MESSSRCCNWWGVLLTIALSIVLAIGAISTTSSSHRHPRPECLSLSLRKSGFSFFASLLQNNPNHFFPHSLNSTTLFAIKDSSFSPLSLTLPPWLARDPLNYHIAPTRLPFQTLLHNKTLGSCIPTLQRSKNLVVTKADRPNKIFKINGVKISHPTLFMQGQHIIHGVPGPFYSFHRDDLRCVRDSGQVAPGSPILEIETGVPWVWILSLLSSHGFISFSMALNSVLDEILEDYNGIQNVTIFMPQDEGFGYVVLPSPLLSRIVRWPRGGWRLWTWPVKRIREELRVTSSELNSSVVVSVNGVEVVQLDLISKRVFVIHGIDRAFEAV
ncbi:hypothetical protein AMTRI_Chr02g260560 [Amborella trichopoda]